MIHKTKEFPVICRFLKVQAFYEIDTSFFSESTIYLYFLDWKTEIYFLDTRKLVAYFKSSI